MEPFFEYKFNFLPIKGGKNRYIFFVYKDINLAGTYYHHDAMFSFCQEKNDNGYLAFFDPKNPYDRNAIVIENTIEETLGYVPREIAAEIAIRDDKDSLYIRPRYKQWRLRSSMFVFDIVSIPHPELMSDDEIVLYTKILKRRDTYPLYIPIKKLPKSKQEKHIHQILVKNDTKDFSENVSSKRKYGDKNEEILDKKISSYGVFFVVLIAFILMISIFFKIKKYG